MPGYDDDVVDINIEVYQLNDQLSFYTGLHCFHEVGRYGEAYYYFVEPSSEPRPSFDDWILPASIAAYN